MYVYTILYVLQSLSIKQNIISSQERHPNMKWFDAGTKKMSGSSFGKFIKSMKLPVHGSCPGTVSIMIPETGEKELQGFEGSHSGCGRRAAQS